jgi:hypothetical protein
MGDFRDMHDLSLFARSPEGEAVLEEIRHQLEGRTIEKVSFSNEVNYIATTLELDDGSTFFIMQPSLEIGAIREQFEEVLDRQEEVEPLDLSESKRSK